MHVCPHTMRVPGALSPKRALKLKWRRTVDFCVGAGNWTPPWTRASARNCGAISAAGRLYCVLQDTHLLGEVLEMVLFGWYCLYSFVCFSQRSILKGIIIFIYSFPNRICGHIKCHLSAWQVRMMSQHGSHILWCWVSSLLCNNYFTHAYIVFSYSSIRVLKEQLSIL